MDEDLLHQSAKKVLLLWVRFSRHDVLKRIVEADAVVYATPLYLWGFASKIHALMERHISLVTGHESPRFRSLVEGKKAELVGKYIVAGTTVPDEIEEKAADVIRRMAVDFGG